MQGLQTSRGARGFTLVEVLVAVLILAVGVIGAAASQATALRTRHTTALMSAGVQLATSLAERMQANAGPGLDEASAHYLQLRYDAVAEGAPAAPALQCFAGVVCTRAELAAFDTYEVRRTLHADYPGARIVVCRDGVVLEGTAAALSWECRGDAGAPVVIKLGWLERGRDALPMTPALAVVVAGVFS